MSFRIGFQGIEPNAVGRIVGPSAHDHILFVNSHPSKCQRAWQEVSDFPHALQRTN